jgi:hypothetical protein
MPIIDYGARPHAPSPLDDSSQGLVIESPEDHSE